jgi:hypothetical protein
MKTLAIRVARRDEINRRIAEIHTRHGELLKRRELEQLQGEYHELQRQSWTRNWISTCSRPPPGPCWRMSTEAHQSDNEPAALARAWRVVRPLHPPPLPAQLQWRPVCGNRQSRPPATRPVGAVDRHPGPAAAGGAPGLDRAGRGPGRIAPGVHGRSPDHDRSDSLPGSSRIGPGNGLQPVARCST